MNRSERIRFRLAEYIKNPFCFWCGEGMLLFCDNEMVEEIATIEHLVPIRDGGPDNNANLRLVHKRCNR